METLFYSLIRFFLIMAGSIALFLIVNNRLVAELAQYSDMPVIHLILKVGIAGLVALGVGKIVAIPAVRYLCFAPDKSEESDA